jgi:hypothetical protein
MNRGHSLSPLQQTTLAVAQLVQESIAAVAQAYFYFGLQANLKSFRLLLIEW